MSRLTKPLLFASSTECEQAFYDALERADLDAMMAVWAEDEEIVCVHPAGPRHAGYAAVQESWRQIFSGGPRLKVRVSHQVFLHGVMLAIHSVHENISIAGEETLRPPVVATNVYLRGTQGWRMLVHHASPSPVPPELMPESSKTLH